MIGHISLKDDFYNLYNNIYNTISESIVIINDACDIIYVNDASILLFNYEKSVLLNENIDLLISDIHKTVLKNKIYMEFALKKHIICEQRYLTKNKSNNCIVIEPSSVPTVDYDKISTNKKILFQNKQQSSDNMMLSKSSTNDEYFKYLMIKKNDKEKKDFFYADITIRSIKFNNSILGVVLIKDLTQILYAHKIIDEKNAQLVRASSTYENLREINNKHEEFMDTLCHELRNPLNGLIWTIDYLNDNLKEIDENFKKVKKNINSMTSYEDYDKWENLLYHNHSKYIHDIKNYSAQTKTVLDDILYLSKLNNNKLEIVLRRINILDYLKNIIDNYESKYDEIRINLNAQSAFVWIDCDQLKQVINNLITNAIRAMNNIGKLTLNVNFEDTTHDKTKNVHLSISDTGTGLYPWEIDNIFNRFKQINRTKNAYFGTGFGLQISKKIIENMGGKIIIKSEKFNGSTFTVSLFNVSVELDNTISENIIEEKINISDNSFLIVDDVEVNRIILHKILFGLGITKIDFAINGHEAIVKSRQTKYDVILMDIEMPIYNGLEVTQNIRDDITNLNYTTYIIGVTGYTSEKIKNKIINVGMDNYISKPVSKTILLEIINSLTLRRNVSLMSMCRSLNCDKFNNDNTLINENNDDDVLITSSKIWTDSPTKSTNDLLNKSTTTDINKSNEKTLSCSIETNDANNEKSEKKNIPCALFKKRCRRGNKNKCACLIS